MSTSDIYLGWMKNIASELIDENVHARKMKNVFKIIPLFYIPPPPDREEQEKWMEELREEIKQYQRYIDSPVNTGEWVWI